MARLLKIAKAMRGQSKKSIELQKNRKLTEAASGEGFDFSEYEEIEAAEAKRAEQAATQARYKQQQKDLADAQAADYNIGDDDLPTPVTLKPEPSAKPATSVADSPAANTKLDDFSGGAGKETTAAPKSGEPIPQNASNPPVPPKSDFSNDSGVGSDKDPMDTFFKEKLNTKGLSNADKRKLTRVRDNYQNYNAQKAELAIDDTEGLNKLNNEFGLKHGADPIEHFKSQANGEATTMDWVMGNHVPQYAGGAALIGGAVASCFSNKGKMSNSELYGQNF